MRVVTWNVNSLNARLARVLQMLERHAPDVVLLQETKCADPAFPVDALLEAGYTAAAHGTGAREGVAILARADGPPITDVAIGLDGGWVGDVASEARWIEATVGDVRCVSVYVINGRSLDAPQFADKLVFLEAMAGRVAALRATGTPLVVAGDVNVCPTDADVYDPAAFAGGTHVTPQERERLAEVLEAGGLVDAYRRLHPEDEDPPRVPYTWWDYRQGHFHRGLGLRIDLVMVSEPLARGLTACGIDRDLRKGTKPSDHAPLIADLTAV